MHTLVLKSVHCIVVPLLYNVATCCGSSDSASQYTVLQCYHCLQENILTYFLYVLQVDEKGAVAAAGTAIQISVMSIAVPIKHVPIFRVDHPFFISIVWNNSVPLFMGHITEPKED
ncbi:unnamed protein product [Trichobilharzia regenti]|nr:unnamed protein product [Trichobilharzia regenti]